MAAEEIAFPGAHQIVLQRCKPRTLPQLFAIERLAHCPAGVNAPECAQATQRAFDEASVAPGSIGRKRRANAFEEDLVVWARARRRTYRTDTVDTVGEQGSPVQRLLAAHGPPVRKGQAGNAEFLAQQT